jgi:hypothetical protein
MKEEIDLIDSAAGPALLPRRQFLVLGTTAVAVAAATSVSAEIVRGALVTEDQTPRLSVGFADATVADFTTRPSFAPRLTAASRLRSGDSSLRGGVRVKVHGVVRPEASRNENVSMGLDALYRPAGRSEEVSFLAWSHARMGLRTATSSSTDFVVPVDHSQPLSLVVSTSAVKTTVDTARLRAAVNLSLGGGWRANKLRQGLYFVAICPAGSGTPDWSSIRAVAPESGNVPVLKQATLTGLVPVPFDYLVVGTARA